MLCSVFKRLTHINFHKTPDTAQLFVHWQSVKHCLCAGNIAKVPIKVNAFVGFDEISDISMDFFAFDEISIAHTRFERKQMRDFVVAYLLRVTQIIKEQCSVVLFESHKSFNHSIVIANISVDIAALQNGDGCTFEINLWIKYPFIRS